MPTNICEPTNVYGPINHWLFLGSSIMSFSASAGWNEQVSEVTVQLVDDDCPAPASKPKHYMTAALARATTTAADPGFYGPSHNIIGSPVYFRVDEFEFSGLIQSWEEQNSASGKPTYLVKIVDPRQLLEGTQLIINEYAGGVGDHHNLINVFGYMESFGVPCAQYYQSDPGIYSPGDDGIDGAVFGTPAGGYGGANTNDNGMQWNRISSAIQILLGSVTSTTNIWSPFGRIVYRGLFSVPLLEYGFINAGVDGLSKYIVDISELPAMPTYWRLNGSNVTLMEAISKVLQDSGYDYYIELLPTISLGSVVNVIKIRTVSRNTQPNFGAIDDFIGEATGVISNNKGRELRNEVTSAFVIGGPKQTIYQAEEGNDPDGAGDGVIKGINGITGESVTVNGCEESDDMILPYFGLNDDGDIIVPCKNNDDLWEFDVITVKINEELQTFNLPIGVTVTINEHELLFALGGYDAWLSYETSMRAAGKPTDVGAALPAAVQGLFDIGDLAAAMAKPNFKAAIRDFVNQRINAFQGRKDVAGQRQEDLQSLFKWIEKFAKDFYGKQFMVRVPFTCAKFDGEAQRAFTSETPAQDGWTEVTPVIGLPNDSALIDFFRNDTNKIGAFCRINDAEDKETKELDPNEFGIWNDNLFIKIDVEEEFVYHDKSSFFAPRVVISLPQSIQIKENDNPKGLKMLMKLANAVANLPPDKIEDAMKGVAGKIGFGPMQNPMNMPNGIAVGMLSNILTYGPWVKPGLPGQTRVEHQEGLVPWEYGGYATLNLAGQSIADEGVSNMQVGEKGHVQVPGYPTLPLGAEIGAVGGVGGAHLIESRALGESEFADTSAGGAPFTTDYYTVSAGGAWTGIFGPNITNLDVTVGGDGITTSYTLRTFTPKFGRFARANAERLKQVGQNRVRGQKELRAFILERVKRDNIKKNIEERRPRGNDGAGMDEPRSPHEVFVGEIISSVSGDNFTRTIISTTPVTEMPNEMLENFGVKAFMSLDGLIRPISMDGDGGLPQYATPAGGCLNGGPVSAIPPVNKDTGCSLGASVYNDAINIDYLNPFANPTGKARSDLPTDKSDTPNVGHDIDILGRDGTGSGGTPPDGMVMSLRHYDTLTKADYQDDYRGKALRGPLIIHGWGYDTNGRPIPNKADSESSTEVGIFTGSATECKFLDDWLRKPKTWPVGPVDLRWDRERACWVAPPTHRVLEATLCEDLCPQGSAIATVSISQTLYDCDGIAFNPGIVVYDRVGDCMSSGDKLLAEYDTYDCKHFVIHRKTESVVQFSLTDCLPKGGPGSGSLSTGDEVVLTDPCGEWGPSKSGSCGWALRSCDAGSDSCFTYKIIWVQMPAQYIEFVTTSDFAGGTLCPGSLRADASVVGSWNGYGITSESVGVDLLQSYNAACFPAGTRGFASLNTNATNVCDSDDDCGELIYTIIEMNTMLTAHTSGCFGGGSVQNFDMKNVVWGTGLAVENVSEPNMPCALQISVDNTIFSDNTLCVTGDDIGLAGQNYQKITLGRGFNLRTDGPCAVQIGAGIIPLDTDECLDLTKELTSDGIKKFNTFEFAQGLRAFDDDSDNCKLKIGAGLTLSTISGCVPTGDIDQDGLYSALAIGKGLSLKGGGDACSAELGLNFTIDGIQVAEIETGSCLSFTGGDCSGVLDFAHKIEPTGVEFVIDVECSGSSIIVTTNFMHFNECGQFVGVSPSGDVGNI